MGSLNDRLRRRLDLRKSNAAVPHRNRYREHKSEGTPYPSWLDEWDNVDDAVYDREDED